MYCIYAFGGGWGHLTRAIALARALRGRKTRVFANSPYLRQVRSRCPELDIVEAGRDDIVPRIAGANPKALIVDTFPRGLGGELVPLLHRLAVPKILIHRDLHPAYAAWAEIETFVPVHYSLVLVPGEGEGGVLRDLPQTRVTAPWLVRGASPMCRLTPTQALVIAGGNPEELPWYGLVAARIHETLPDVSLRVVAATEPPGCPPGVWSSYWPAIDLISKASVVVGSGGYNTVYECRAYDVPLVARAWPRKYDRQKLRAMRNAQAIVNTPDEAAAALAEWLVKPRPVRTNHKPVNGARDAALEIENLVDEPSISAASSVVQMPGQSGPR